MTEKEVQLAVRMKHGHLLTYVALFFMFLVPLTEQFLFGRGSTGLVLLILQAVSGGFGFVLLLLALIIRVVKA